MIDITKRINHVAPDALVLGHKELTQGAKGVIPRKPELTLSFYLGIHRGRLETDILLSSPSGLWVWI
jgi:hypothetical protein